MSKRQYKFIIQPPRGSKKCFCSNFNAPTKFILRNFPSRTRINMDEKFKNFKLPRALELELSKVQQRPSWESSNEGIHERVNFDDTLWGFNLAGGVFYNTPLRVTQVKQGSRAEHAGIKVGDTLRCINEVDTSTLTVQEAHDIILQSGLEIKLSLSAPDVDETTHYLYEDEYVEELKEIRRLRGLIKQEHLKTFKGAKTNEAWSIAWPCNKKRDVMYKESNCYLIPSKYEGKHVGRVKSTATKNNDSTAAKLNSPI